MADAILERRPSATRFFCHRCNIEFQDVLQDYRCPYCASGFIEQLEGEGEGSVISENDFSDPDMSNVDDSDDMPQSANHPMLSDLAFLMSGGRQRGTARGPETLLESLVYSLGGTGGLVGAGTVNAGTPFVLVGAPGDYVFGGEGLDAVVTQLLGQLENAGPPPLPRDQIAAIPSEAVTEEQAAANTSCSVCWDNFKQGEMVSRLQCEHMFHSSCIEPWLQLHATCPICRRSLLPEDAAAADPPVPPRPSSASDRPAGSGATSAAGPAGAGAGAAAGAGAGAGAVVEVEVERALAGQVRLRRLARRAGAWAAGGGAWAAGGGAWAAGGGAVSAAGLWARDDSASESSLASASEYNMDIDYD